MPRRRSLSLASALVVLGASWLHAPGAAGQAVRPAAPPAGPGSPKLELARGAPSAVGGKVLVQFRPGVARAERAASHARAGGRVLSRIRRFGVEVVRVPPGGSVGAVIDRYLRDPAVEFAEPNVARVLAVPPNDPSFAGQWGLQNTGQAHPVGDPPPDTASGTSGADVRAIDAWDALTGGGEAVVAVIDTGVAHTHNDLRNRMWTNPGEIAANGLDDDGNGYIDDVNGYDFQQGDGNPAPGSAPSDEHGTHVAGILAAERGNAIGIAGVCPSCRIMALRFALDIASEIEAIAYAVDNGADIINASYSGSIWSNIERNAIRRAGRRGVLFVAAAGNEAADNDMLLPTPKGAAAPTLSPQFPASYDLPQIVAVAASNHRDRYGYLTGCATELPNWSCLFTNWGHESVDLVAPGVDILSTIPGGYATLSGTSMATPLVSGAAGLLKVEHPEYGPKKLKHALMNGANKPTSLRRLPLRGGPFRGAFTRTAGRLNVLRGLAASPANAWPKTDGNINGARLLRRVNKGRISWPNDVNDVFKKRLRRGNRYEITLAGPKGPDYDLWVWKRGTKEIWQLSAGCFAIGGVCPILKFSTGVTASETIRLRARRTGVYFIHVTSFFSTGRYTLRIRRL